MKTDIISYCLRRTLEAGLALIFLAPVIENSLSIAMGGSPINIFPFAVLITLIGLINKRPQISRPFIYYTLSLIAFLCFVLASTFYTHSNSFWVEKLIRLANIIFPFFLIPFISLPSLKNSLRLATFVGVPFLILFYTTFNSALIDREILDATDRIGAAYLQIGFISGLLFLFNFHRMVNTPSILTLALLIFYLTCAFLSGARGPLFFALLSAVLLILLSNSKKSYITAAAGVALVAIGSIFALGDNDASQLIERSTNRLSLLFADDKGSSIDGRLGFIDQSLELINDAPILGYGFGSYGKVTTGIDEFKYPHNMILEVYFEIGIFGLLTYLLMLCVPFFYARKSLLGSENLTLFYTLSCYLILNALKSNSFTDLRILFLILAIPFIFKKLNSTQPST